MKRVILDVETDNFLETLTRVHCLVIRDLDSDRVLSCTDDPKGREMGYRPIAEGLDLLQTVDRIYGHNLVIFDRPALKKVYPHVRLSADLRDTYLIAQMRWAHIREEDFKRPNFPKNLAGLHTLEAWGHRLGERKIEYTQWCTDNGIAEPFKDWRPEMQTYCEGDTGTTKRVVELIRSADVSAESVEIETELAEYLAAQMEGGWPFDMDRAVQLVADMTAKRALAAEKLIETFKGWYVFEKEATPKVNSKKFGWVKGSPFSKIKYVEFNPSSRDHIANRLMNCYGWKPQTFTDGGKPEVDEGTLKGLAKQHAVIAHVIDYLLLDKRLGMISEGKQAWLKHATNSRPQGGAITGMHHIHARIKQNHAVTHRAAASSPPIHGTPKVGNPYGAECRELYRVPEGWDEVGADISGLELRNLAHYLARYDGGNFTRVLLEGDPHTETQKLLIEHVGDGKPGRDKSKTFRYAYLYGGGDVKLGSILAPAAPESKQKKIGASARALFVNGTPGLKYLTEALEHARVTKGYLLAPDGRRGYVRHKHAVLNTLLQMAGAVIAKRWIIDSRRIMLREFGEPGWRGQWSPMGWSHDELQQATRPVISTDVATLLVATIRKVGEHYEWRCPLDGQATVGKNWRDCH